MPRQKSLSFIGNQLIQYGHPQMPAFTYLGTSSWNFDGWHGLIYPETTRKESSHERLRNYMDVGYMNTVCVDHSYYKRPASETWRHYASYAPTPFRFVIKLPQRWTRADLYPTEFLDFMGVTEFMTEVATGLEQKLGLILFQMSPGLSTHVSPAELYEAMQPIGDFAAQHEIPVSLEVRDTIYFDRRHHIHEHQPTLVPCLLEHPSVPMLRQQTSSNVLLQAESLLIRWMLNRAYSYEAAREAFQPFVDCRAEAPAIRHFISQTIAHRHRLGLKTIVIVNNKAEGSSPRTTLALLKMIRASIDNA